MFDDTKTSIEVKRTKLGDSFRYVTFRFRTKSDLIDFANKINRPELSILDKNNNKAGIIWDNKDRIDLESFFE